MRPSLNMVSSLIFFLLQFHLFTVFVIFLTFRTWNGVNGSCEYEKCSTSLRSCGNITNIGYPFWGDHFDRPKYCGHPAMKLECHSKDGDSEYPILKLDRNGGKSFPVLGIRNFTITIPLLDIDSPPHCLVPSVSRMRVTNLDDQKWVTYSSSVMNITLSYGCDSKRIDVAENDTISVCRPDYEPTYYLWRSPAEIELCKSYAPRFPVLIKEFNDYNKRRIQPLEDALSKGFEVEFLRSYSELCQRCRSSGGECGSSGEKLSQFTCHCFNGSHPNSCPVNPGPKLTISLVIVGIFILTTLIVGIWWFTKHKLRSPTFLSRTIADDQIMSDVEFGNSLLGIPVFSYTKLQEATNNFEGELGNGGFGVVYHGD